MTGELLRELLKKHNMTQGQLAEKLTNSGYNKGQGIKTAAISKYILGQRKITSDFIKATLEILGENDVNILFSDKPFDVKRIKISGSVSCGLPINDIYECSDEFTYISISESKPTFKAVVANGDSMFPLIEDGDIIIYDTDPFVKAKHGDLVVYGCNNETACKVLVEKKEVNIIEFKPINQSDTFKTTTFKLDENINDLEIYKVIKIQKTPTNAKSNLKLVGEN